MNSLVINEELSKYNGWKLVTAIPREVLTEQIGPIRYVSITLCVLAIVIGLLICLTYWLRRKDLVQEYFELQVRLGNSGRSVGKKDTWFWKNFGWFLSSVDKLQETLKQQEEMVKEAFFRRLLYGGYESEEQIRNLAGNAGVSLKEETCYYVADLEFEDPFKGDFECSREEFARMLAEHFRKFLPWDYWVYKASELSCVLILCSEEEISGEELKKVLSGMNDDLYRLGKIQCYTGISACARELMEISRQYEAASESSEFARYRGIRMPILAGEQSAGQAWEQPVFFSADMELKLRQYIQRGTMEQLEEILGQIKKEYFSPETSQCTYRYAVEILRSAVFRSIPAEDDSVEAKRLREEAQSVRWEKEILALIRKTKAYCMEKNLEKEEAAADLDQKAVADYIEEHLKDVNLNLCMLAEWLNEPERKVYQDFKVCFGMSFSNYLEQRRICRACEFLKQGMAVKETAEQTGYGSDYSFRRAFKRVVGIPPSDFQKLQTK